MAAFRTLWTCAKAVPSTADANRQSQLATIRRARMCPPELVATLCVANLHLQPAEVHLLLRWIDSAGRQLGAAGRQQAQVAVFRGCRPQV